MLALDKGIFGYTVPIIPLKHHDWVKKEIEQLECAGIIEKSLSPWASPK